MRRSALALACVVLGAWGCSDGKTDAVGTVVRTPDYAPPTPRPEVPVSDPIEAAPADAASIAGRVLDYDTGVGIGGARLETFLPTSERMSREDGTYVLIEGVEPYAEFYRLWVTHPDYATSSATLTTEEIQAVGVDVELVSLENAIRGRLEPASAHFAVDRHSVSMSLLNTGRGTLSVSTERLPEWLEMDPPQLAIQPDARGTFRLRLRPDRVRAELEESRSDGAPIRPSPTLRGVFALVDAQTGRKALLHTFVVLGDVVDEDGGPRLVADGDVSAPLVTEANVPVGLAWTARVGPVRPLQDAQVRVQICAGELPEDATRCPDGALELERWVTSDADGRAALDLAITQPGTFTVLASVAAYAEDLDTKVFTRQRLVVNEDSSPTFSATFRIDTASGDTPDDACFTRDELPMTVVVKVENNEGADTSGRCVVLDVSGEAGLALSDTVEPSRLCGDGADPMARLSDGEGQARFELSAARLGTAQLAVAVEGELAQTRDVQIADNCDAFPGELVFGPNGVTVSDGVIEVDLTLSDAPDGSTPEGAVLDIITEADGVVVRPLPGTSNKETFQYTLDAEGRVRAVLAVERVPDADQTSVPVQLSARLDLAHFGEAWRDRPPLTAVSMLDVDVPRSLSNVTLGALPLRALPDDTIDITVCAEGPNPYFEYPLAVTVNDAVVGPARFVLGDTERVSDAPRRYRGCLEVGGVRLTEAALVNDAWVVTVELGNARRSETIVRSAPVMLDLVESGVSRNGTTYAAQPNIVTVTLQDTDGAWVSGLEPELTIEPVSVVGDLPVEAVVARLSATDAAGVASYEWTPPLPGTYLITARAGGGALPPVGVTVVTPFELRAVDVPRPFPRGTRTDVTLEVWNIARNQPQFGATVDLAVVGDNPADLVVGWDSAPAPLITDDAGQLAVWLDAQEIDVWQLEARVDGVPSEALEVESARAPIVNILGIGEVFGDVSGCATLDYWLEDADRDTVDLTVRYRTLPGGDWQRATQGYSSDFSTVRGLDAFRPTGSPSIRTGFVWDAPRDLGRPLDGERVGVELEVTARARKSGLSGVGTLSTRRLVGMGLGVQANPLIPDVEGSRLDDVAYADFEGSGRPQLVTLRTFDAGDTFQLLEVGVWAYDGVVYGASGEGNVPTHYYPINRFANGGRAAYGDFDDEPTTAEIVMLGQDLPAGTPSLRRLRFGDVGGGIYRPIEDAVSDDVSAITSHKGLHTLRRPNGSDWIAFISEGAVYTIRDPFLAAGALEQLIGPTGVILDETGLRTLNEAPPLGEPPTATALLAHDLNDDGFDDLLVVLDEGPGEDDEHLIPVMFGVGGPEPLGVGPALPAGLGAVRQLAVGDVDGDGDDDLVFRAERNGAARVAWMLRDHTRLWLEDPSVLGAGGGVDLPAGVALTDLAVMDLTQQGAPATMLAASDSGVWTVRHDAPTASPLRDRCHVEGACQTGSPTVHLAADPKRGLLALGADAEVVPLVAENTRSCSPRLELPQAFALPDGPGQGVMAMADLNLDGRPDLVHALDNNGAELRAWFGRGDGSFKGFGLGGSPLLAQRRFFGSVGLHAGVMRWEGQPNGLAVVYAGRDAEAYRMAQLPDTTVHNVPVLDPCGATSLVVTDVATNDFDGDEVDELVFGCRDAESGANSWVAKPHRYNASLGLFQDFLPNDVHTVRGFEDFSCPPSSRCDIVSLAFVSQGAHPDALEPLADVVVLGEAVQGQTPTSARLIMAYNRNGEFFEVAAVTFPAIPEGLDMMDLDGDGRDDAVVRLRNTNGSPLLQVARFDARLESWRAAVVPLTGAGVPLLRQVLSVAPLDAGADGLRSMMILASTQSQGVTTLIATPDDNSLGAWTVRVADELPAAVNDADALITADIDGDGRMDAVFSERTVEGASERATLRMVRNATDALDDAPFVSSVGLSKALTIGTPKFMTVFNVAAEGDGSLAALAYVNQSSTRALASAYDLDVDPSQWQGTPDGGSFPEPTGGLMMDVNLDGTQDLVMWAPNSLVVRRLDPDANPPQPVFLPMTRAVDEPPLNTNIPGANIRAAHVARLSGYEDEHLVVLSKASPFDGAVSVQLFEKDAGAIGPNSLRRINLYWELSSTAGALEDTAATDVDGDGLTDFVLASGLHGVYVFYGRNHGTSIPMVELVSPNHVIRRVEAADMTQSGRPDLAVIGTNVDNNAHLAVWEHNGSNRWTASDLTFGGVELPLYEPDASALAVVPAPEFGGALITVTYPSRGLVDVFLARREGSLSVSRWGTFGLPGESMADVEVLDRDGDGWLDLLMLVGRTSPDEALLRVASGDR